MSFRQAFITVMLVFLVLLFLGAGAICVPALMPAGIVVLVGAAFTLLLAPFIAQFLTGDR